MESAAHRSDWLGPADSLEGEDQVNHLLTSVAKVATRRTSRPIAIYVGIPFCAYKCHFCDWVSDLRPSQLRSGPDQRSAYLDALCHQIRYFGPRLTDMGYCPTYMYWGGGTPTRLNVAEMVRIHSALRDAFDLSRLHQWTVESTPNDLDAEKLLALIDFGVNRISLGVQSLDAGQLRRSGRGHSPAQALAALTLLGTSAIETVNVDVMTGFPDDTLQMVEETITRLIECDIEHFSIYSFRAIGQSVTGKRIGSGAIPIKPLDQQLRAYELATSLLTQAGYRRGEAHSSLTRDARHEDLDGNYKYLLSGDKMAFGSGAESVIGHHLLWNSQAELDKFVRQPLRFTYARRFDVALPGMFDNFVYAPLMTRTGLDFDRFRTFTGVAFRQLRKTGRLARICQRMTRLGARLVETDESLQIDPECLDRVVLAHQAAVAAHLLPQA